MSWTPDKGWRSSVESTCLPMRGPRLQPQPPTHTHTAVTPHTLTCAHSRSCTPLSQTLKADMQIQSGLTTWRGGKRSVLPDNPSSIPEPVWCVERTDSLRLPPDLHTPHTRTLHMRVHKHNE